MFHYIYAILYSKKYREMFSDQLKSDFAHIPVPDSLSMLKGLAAVGKELVNVHLMKTKDSQSGYKHYIGQENVVVENVRFDNETVFVSKKNDCFQNVPEEVWNMFIGAYQPLQKWLKDWKGTTISHEELQHFDEMIEALMITNQLMNRIDQLIVF